MWLSTKNNGVTTARQLRTLRGDDRGVMMVLGLFMAIFLVAMLYYVVGIGDSVLQREQMQDASDATALATAIWHARGMNYIVLINQIMAALVAILLVMNLALYAVRLGIALAMAFSWLGTASLIPPLSHAERTLNSSYQAVEPVVFGVLRALHTGGRITRSVVPWIAEIDGIKEVVKHHKRAQFGFVIPTRFTLPVEDDQFDRLCEKAGTYAADLAMTATPIRGKVRDKMADAVGSFTGTLSQWLCGDGSASGPPSQSHTEQFDYPVTEAHEACRQRSLRGQALSEEEAEQCERDRQAVATRHYDSAGNCNTTSCSRGGMYHTLGELARQQCRPSGQGSPPTHFEWQELEFEITYRYGDRGWQRLEPEVETERRIGRSNTPPCGSNGIVGPEWLTQYWESNDPDDPDYQTVTPLCVEVFEDQIPTGQATPGTETVVTYRVVEQLLACTKTERFNIDGAAGGATPLGKDSGGKQPFKVEQNLELGGNDFQMRAVVFGRGVDQSPEKVMELAAWKRCDASDTACQSRYIRVLAQVSRLSVAQAEYYYAGTEAREDWLWHYKWRARLRRFHFDGDEHSNDKRNRRNPNSRRPEAQYAPGPSPTTGLDACRLASGAGEACGNIMSQVDLWSTLLLH